MTASPRISISKTLPALLLAAIVGSALAQEPVPIVIRSVQHNGSQVWAQDRVGAPPVNSAANVQAPGGGGAVSTAVNPTGSNVNVNSSIVAQPSAMVVQGQITCPSVTQPWSASASCSATLPATAAGSTATVSDAEVAVNTGRGSATFTCQASGTWNAVPTAATCAAQCGGGATSWIVAGATCNASLTTANSPVSQTITDATIPGTGSATFTCLASGAWSAPSSSSCINNPPPGTYTSDYFVWHSWAFNAGEGDTGFLNALTINHINAYQVSWDWQSETPTFTGAEMRALTKTGSAFWASGQGFPYIPGTYDYSTYLYPQNCVVGTRSIRNNQYQAPMVTVSGMYCRPGYTP